MYVEYHGDSAIDASQSEAGAFLARIKVAAPLRTNISLIHAHSFVAVRTVIQSSQALVNGVDIETQVVTRADLPLKSRIETKQPEVEGQGKHEC